MEAAAAGGRTRGARGRRAQGRPDARAPGIDLARAGALNRRLRSQIDRSRPSIEFKHRNISTVLKGLGESWITGYLPAFNIQTSLTDAVVRWLHHHPEFEMPAPHVNTPVDIHETARLVIELPPCTVPAPFRKYV